MDLGGMWLAWQIWGLGGLSEVMAAAAADYTSTRLNLTPDMRPYHHLLGPHGP